MTAVDVLEEVTIVEAARRLDRTPNTLWRWVRECRMRIVRRTGNVFVTLAEITRIRACPTVPPPIPELIQERERRKPKRKSG